MADETKVSARLGADDTRRLERLMAHTGIQSKSDLIRFALTELSIARGLETAAQLQRREAS